MCFYGLFRSYSGWRGSGWAEVSGLITKMDGLLVETDVDIVRPVWPEAIDISSASSKKECDKGESNQRKKRERLSTLFPNGQLMRRSTTCVRRLIDLLLLLYKMLGILACLPQICERSAVATE